MDPMWYEERHENPRIRVTVIRRRGSKPMRLKHWLYGMAAITGFFSVVFGLAYLAASFPRAAPVILAALIFTFLSFCAGKAFADTEP